MIIQGLRANTKDPDAHVVFFDIEAMISKILSVSTITDFTVL